jgi:hypothetical protein
MGSKHSINNQKHQTKSPFPMTIHGTSRWFITLNSVFLIFSLTLHVKYKLILITN